MSERSLVERSGAPTVDTYGYVRYESRLTRFHDQRHRIEVYGVKPSEERDYITVNARCRTAWGARRWARRYVLRNYVNVRPDRYDLIHEVTKGVTL